MDVAEFEARSGVVPIQIREDVTVRLVRLPHDLTRAEAEKIGRVVLALAEPSAQVPPSITE